MTVHFDGATAFITGGGQGIGLGLAEALAARGVRLALADIDVEALAAAKAQLSSITAIETFELDVRDRERFARVADEVEGTLGPVSLLFNNAGVATGTSVDSMNYEVWDWVLDINLGGVINGIQMFVPRILARGAGGYIVNTASGAGLAVAGTGFLYTTSKFAVVGLSEALHLELAPRGVGVSVLCPGPVATKIVSNTARQEAAQLGASALERDSENIAATEAMLAAGLAPREVGEMVVAAMEADRLHVPTDTMMVPFVEARTQAILEAMPLPV